MKPAAAGLGLLWLCVIAVSASAANAAAPCPKPAASTRLRLSIDYGKVVHDRSHDSVELGRIEQQDGGKAAHGDRPLGLTVAALTIDGRSETKIRAVAEGVCAYPKSVVLRLGYPTFRVYIDRQFVPGSCRYRTVLDHEHTHVRIARAALRQHATEIRRAVQDYLHANPVLLVADRVAAHGVYFNRLKRVLDPLVKTVDDDAGKGHARLDNPANLERTWRACPGG